jgi:hypothetical protein
MVMYHNNISRYGKKQKKWTEQDIKFLKNNVNKYSNKELSVLFNVSKEAVNTALCKRNIKRKNNKFAKKEIRSIEVCKVDYLDTPCQECISHFLDVGGYPKKKVNGRMTPISRYIYEEHYKTKIPEGKIIRHKCDNPACINIEHLEIGTHQDNAQDRIKRNRSAKGIKNSNSKLTDNQVREIKKELINYKIGDIVRLAKKYKIGHGVISNIRNNRAWTHIKID